MAFLEKMGETLAAKSKDVADKAREMAEVNRLNGQIHSQTNAAEKIYVEIGRMVCENRENWGQVDATEQLEQLDAVQAEIMRLQEEILRVKGIRKCEICGAAIDMRLSHCPECGAAITIETLGTESAGQEGQQEERQGQEEQEKQQRQEGVFCQECNRKLEQGMLFCPFCGKKQK